jgi:hypothetical protein
MNVGEMTHAPSRNGNMVKYEYDMDILRYNVLNVMKYGRYLGKMMEK